MLKSNNRVRAPGEDEWQRIKPILERLYMQDNLSLERMADVLSTEHEFNAKLNMYKTRLRKWKIRKNFKRQELALAATTVEPFWKVGLEPPAIALNGRMVPIERVKRHFGHALRRSTIYGKMGRNLAGVFAEPSDTQAALPAEQQRVVIPRLWLQQSPEMHALETALIETNKYFSWRLTVDDDVFLQRQSLGQAGMFQLTPPFQLCNSFSDTMFSLWSSNSLLAQHHTNEIMKLAPRVFAEQHPGLILAVIRLGLQPSFDIEGQVHAAVVAYLSNVASRLLTEHHPISKVLRLRRLHTDSSVCFYRLMSLLRAVTVNHRGEYSDLAFDFEEVLALASTTGSDADASFCRNLLTRYVRVFGAGHWRCRKLFFTLAMYYHNENMLTDAESLCQRLLFTIPSDSGNISMPDWTTVMAMGLQACLYRNKGAYLYAAYWFRRAHVGFAHLYGLEDSRAQFSLRQAESMELENERNQGLVTFRETHSMDAETTTHIVENLVNDLEDEVLRFD